MYVHLYSLILAQIYCYKEASAFFRVPMIVSHPETIVFKCSEAVVHLSYYIKFLSVEIVSFQWGFSSSQKQLQEYENFLNFVYS